MTVAAPRLLLSHAALAHKLGLSARSLSRHKPALYRRGFPAPVLCGRTDWDAVRAWLDREGSVAPRFRPAAHARDESAAAEAARLDARADRLARQQSQH